jgi:ABC-type phosphate transport system substrate-binding protein
VISKNRLAIAAISAGLVTTLLGMGAAQADPTGAPSPRALVGVGSDTVQDVMNQISNDVVIGGVKQLGSFNATGSATINTGKAGCSAVPRPNGSGAGRTALLNSLTTGDPTFGCVQFARSSSLNTATSTPSLTYVPFAIDAVSYAVTANSALPRSFNLADLQAIYHCDPNYVGTGTGPGTFAINPVLPQAGSGTRSYWEGQMGISDTALGSCIINGVLPGTSTIIEEHTATFLTSTELVPFSIGQYTSQANGLIIDRRGNTVLGVIGTGAAGAAITGATDPQVINGSFNVKRDVYNVIPTSQTGAAPYSTVFVGAGSLICQDTATILHYGFSLNPNCGSIAAHS